MSFHPPTPFLALFFWALALMGLSAHPMDDDHVWGTQTLAGLAESFASQMAMTESRYPFVVYQEGSYHGLRSVAWKNGLKYDEPIPPTSDGVLGFKVAAAGTQVFLAYQTLSGLLRISSLTNAGWTPPEPIPLQSDVSDFVLGVTPAGEPLVLQSFEYGKKIALCRRTAQGWTSEIVPKNSSYSISSMFLTASEDGRIHVGYREYSSSSGNSTNNAIHASLINGQWTVVQIFTGFLDAFFAGPDGFPRAIGHAANGSPPRYSECGVGGWSAPVPIPNPGDVVSSASMSKDGTIYATAGQNLIFRKSGLWATVPEIYSRQVIADDLGFPHLLGMELNVLACHTRTRSSWQTSLVTPIDGSSDIRLAGLAMSVTDRPQIFTSSQAVPAIYQEQAGTWARAPISHSIYPAEYAIDAQDKLHIFGPFGSYGYGTRTSLAFEWLPVTIGSSSSSDLNAIVLDQQGRPHVSFIYQGGTSAKAVKYAVKTAGTWSVETVGAYQSTPHSAVAVDPAGTPFVFTSEGLYQKTPAGWTKQFAVYNANLPCLVIAADFTVHAIFLSNAKLYALSGKDGNYTVELLAGGVNFRQKRLSLALLHGRPIATFVVTLSYPYRNSVRFAEKTGNYWRQETILPITDDQEYGEQVRITASAQGDVLVAAERTYELDHYVRTYLQFHRKGPPNPAALDRTITCWGTPAGKHGFHLRLPDTPVRHPAHVQQSTDLAAWENILDLTDHPDPAATTDQFYFKSDGFHTDLFLEAPPGEKSRFLRIVEVR